MNHKPPDENDLLRAGELPDDPFEDPPMSSPHKPKKSDEAPPAITVSAALGEIRSCCFKKQTETFLAELASRRKGDVKPIKTPWECIDRELGGGLWPGLYFLVGGTGSGKSQFAMQLAIHAALDGTPVLYVALELAPLDLFARTISLMQESKAAKDKWSEYWFGEKPVPEDGRIDFDRVRNLPFHWAVGKPQGWPASFLSTYTEALKQEYPTAKNMLVVIDFVQLLGPDVPGQSLRERIGSAAYTARAVARDHKASVLALSSVAREYYATLTGDKSDDGKRGPGNKPTPIPMGQGDPGRFVGLGKESGEVEFAADNVLVMGREPWINGMRPSDGTHIHVAIAKARAKARETTGWAELRFDGSVFSEPRQKDVCKLGELP